MYNFLRLFAFACTFLVAGTLAAQPTAGLIGHWGFNGNANDLSGNGHHGNIHNVTSVAGKLGAPNTGYLFNSLNSYVSIPYHSDFNVNSAISICAIIKPTVINTNLCQGNFIVSRGSQGSSGGYLLSFFDNAYNDCTTADTNSFVFTGQAGPTVLNASLWTNSTKVHTNNWYCVVLTYDGTNCKIYVDGALTITLPGWSPTVGSSTDSISIGKYLWGGALFPYNFIGVMDDVAIYNRALADSEALSYCSFAALVDTSVSILPLNKTSFCPGDTFHVNYTVSSNFKTGNVFTAQLSNSAGSFAAPVTVGSATSSTSGTIVCTIPAGTPAGFGYRVRVAGSNPVRLSDNNGVNLTVKPVPAAPNANNNTPVCSGETINLTASTVPGATYSWTGPSFTSSVQNPSITNASTANVGVYSVTATVNGCTSPADTTTVKLSATPMVNIYPSPNDTICDGSKVTFVALPFPPGTNLTYQWLVNNTPVSGATNVSFPTTGIVDGDMVACVMTNPTACATAYTDTSNYIHMTVLPWLAPSVTITSNPTTPLSPNEMINFTATAINAGNSPKYQWQRNNTDIVGALSDTWGTWQLYNNDSISVIVKSSYLCPQPTTDTSNYIRVVVLTSVDDAGNRSKIALYPNPSNGKVIIKGDINITGKANMEIINMAGQVVYHSAIATHNGKLYEELNLEHLAAGAYTAVIKSEAKNYTIKFNISR